MTLSRLTVIGPTVTVVITLLLAVAGGSALRGVVTSATGTVDNCLYCPAEQEILPCQCKSRGRNVLLSCRRSSLDELTLILAVVAQKVTVLEELMLEDNDLNELPAGTFGQLSVRRLFMWNNGLEKLANNSLDPLGFHLTELHIREPRLGHLPDRIFDAFHSLEKLVVERTPIARLPRLASCQSLTAIHVDGSEIDIVGPSSVADLPHLDTLQLTNSKIRLFGDQALSNLPRLTVVNLTANQLTTMKRGWWHNLPSLKVVDLRSNALKEIHSVLDLLRPFAHNLQSLHLDRNAIANTNTGTHVYPFPRLAALTLSFNRIQHVVGTPGQEWPSLRSLDLSHNGLTTMPIVMLSQARSLEHLRLAGNPLADPTFNVRPLLASLPRLRTLNLDNCGIDRIAQQTLGFHASLEQLSLRNNSMRSIEASAFHRLPALTVLDLGNNELSNLPKDPRHHQRLVPGIADLSGVFWHLPSLSSLDLSGNQLETVDATFFVSLSSLRTLNLSRNGLKTIDGRVWKQLAKVDRLDLSRNSLVALDALCPHLSDLERLDASFNQLGRIDERALHCPRLRFVDLSHNKLSTFSDDTFGQHNAVQQLDLSHNALGRIPEALRHLGFLKWLSVSSNWLEELRSDDLSGNFLLEAIDLSRNLIRKLPADCFSTAHHLRTIDLSRNSIDTVPSSVFRHLMSLDRLDLSFNRIHEVEAEAFDPSTALRALDLSHNNITHLSTDGIQLDALQILQLQHNRIDDLSFFSVRNMRSLSELDLSHNAIASVEPRSFGSSRALLRLDLSNNALTVLPSNAFWSLPNLRELNLGRNRIRRVAAEAFYDLVSLEHLLLEENGVEQVDPKAFHGPTSFMRSLNLSRNAIERMEDAGIDHLSSLEVLDLSHNAITEVDGRTLRRLVRLIHLNMDDNSVCRVLANSFQHQRRLTSLSLRNNRLGAVSEADLPPTLERQLHVDLFGNPLQCDCRLLWLFEKAGPGRDELDQCSSGRPSRALCQQWTPPDPSVDVCHPPLELSTAPSTTTTATAVTSAATEAALNRQPVLNNGNGVQTVYAGIRKPPNATASENKVIGGTAVPSKTGAGTGGLPLPIKYGLNFLPALLGVGSLVSGLVHRQHQQARRPPPYVEEQPDDFDLDSDLLDGSKPMRGPDAPEYDDVDDRPFIPLNKPLVFPAVRRPSQQVVFVDLGNQNEADATPSYDQGHWVPAPPPSPPAIANRPESPPPPPVGLLPVVQGTVTATQTSALPSDPTAQSVESTTLQSFDDASTDDMTENGDDDDDKSAASLQSLMALIKGRHDASASSTTSTTTTATTTLATSTTTMATTTHSPAFVRHWTRWDDDDRGHETNSTPSTTNEIRPSIDRVADGEPTSIEQSTGTDEEEQWVYTLYEIPVVHTVNTAAVDVNRQRPTSSRGARLRLHWSPVTLCVLFALMTALTKKTAEVHR